MKREKKVIIDKIFFEKTKPALLKIILILPSFLR